MSPRLPQTAADRARRAPERAPRSAGVWPIRQSRQNDIASRFQRESRPPTKSRPTRFTCSRTGPKFHTLEAALAGDRADEDRQQAVAEMAQAQLELLRVRKVRAAMLGAALLEGGDPS